MLDCGPRLGLSDGQHGGFGGQTGLTLMPGDLGRQAGDFAPQRRSTDAGPPFGGCAEQQDDAGGDQDLR